MWRRVYLLLVLLRLYIALSTSYLHPDEHFQGPEVIAGRVFSFPSHLTWEFTSVNPIRSVFPLWLFYGWPLTLLKWLAEGSGYQHVHPRAVFYTLRALMFVLSFVLEDWALHELLPNSKERRVANLLVASSYVTWTYQTHTFSNSIETLIVLWCLVIIARIVEDKRTSQVVGPAVLAFLCVLGTFNRITFPAFLLIPLLRLLPHFRVKPISLIVMLVAGLATAAFAVALDTEWYFNQSVRFRDYPNKAIITPWNNLRYNLDPANLEQHGLHPFYQHFVANLPQLIGPAMLLLLICPRPSMLLYSALCGVFVLSCFKHQEARFLLPAVPLLLSSVRIPRQAMKVWLGIWLAFNLALGLLMGVYHQGGVVPAQSWIGSQANVTQTFWWKTYSPPTYLLGKGGDRVVTNDLMGLRGDLMIEKLAKHTDCDSSSTLLVAPLSATFLDSFIGGSSSGNNRAVRLEEVWSYRTHLNLDDMDFADDGVIPTLTRVVGRRGIAAWKVYKSC